MGSGCGVVKCVNTTYDSSFRRCIKKVTDRGDVRMCLPRAERIDGEQVARMF